MVDGMPRKSLVVFDELINRFASEQAYCRSSDECIEDAKIDVFRSLKTLPDSNGGSQTIFRLGED
jgi:hypothetical protein